MSIISSKFYGSYDPLSFDVWDPYHDFHCGGTTLAPHPVASSHGATPFSNAKVEWKENPEALVVRADLPGLKKDEVKVELEEGNLLCISGERNIEKEERVDNWYHVERSRGSIIKPGTNKVAAGFFRTGMRTLLSGLSYMVMLVVMSFNGGIFLAAVGGHAVGFVFFGNRISKNSEKKPDLPSH
ncbi:hypothetical protein GH714_015888 [Hevea brasiliensis]|uniref:Copper transport protein n=1 Tax=Hevea brasiliensis TaxID=3981 RepID=A0A6A6LYW4_HEVBR|nr:hypothetical protein GH714_015888 [Hevea brasiliensis]